MAYAVRPQTGQDPPETGQVFFHEQDSELLSDCVREKHIAEDKSAIKKIALFM